MQKRCNACRLSFTEAFRRSGEDRGRKGGREASRRQSRRRQSPKHRVVPSDLVKHDLTKAEGGRAPLWKYSDLRSSAIEEKCPLIFGGRQSCSKRIPVNLCRTTITPQHKCQSQSTLDRGSPVPYDVLPNIYTKTVNGFHPRACMMIRKQI